MSPRFMPCHPVVFALLGMLASLLINECRGQAWREVFNPYRVWTAYLELDPQDWDRIRHDEPVEGQTDGAEVAEAWFRAEGQSAIRVTVRRKGPTDMPLPSAGDPQKVSLKIDFNSVIPDQSWHGLHKLSLENGSDNPLQEGFAWLAHHLADEAGITGYDAANAGWMRLFVNGELKGVYTNAEQRDKQFLKNHDLYSAHSTWLYKVDGNDQLEIGTGDSPTQLHLCYWPFHNDCPQPDLETDLEAWIDMRGMLTIGAVNAFLENNDALITHSGKNSFAVDFFPPQPWKRRYFPWDLDAGIKRGDHPITGSEPYQVEILDHPWWRQVYHQLFRELLDGPLSVTNLHARLDALEAAVGPAFAEDPYVYSGDAAGAFQSLRDWVSRRVPNVREQLSSPHIERPQFNQDGGEVVAGFQLTMTAPAGLIFFTLDGQDPRLPGGAVLPSAQIYDQPMTLDKTTTVMARTYDGNLWSALPTKAVFNIAYHANGLRVTEIMYHPPDDPAENDGDLYEYLELQNQGATPLHLDGFYFDGIDYIFPPGTVLEPGAFWLLVANAVSFSSRYPGVAIDGVYRGSLSNDGEKIRVRNADGNTQISVDYQDSPWWPLSPDGLGYSLVNRHPEGDPDDPAHWRASANPLGSPGTADPEPAYGVGVIINEVLAHTDPPYEDAIELRNPGPTDIDISGWFLSDDLSRTNRAGDYDLKKFQIPEGSIVPAGGFLVFYEKDFNGGNAAVPFALSEWGDEVLLASADQNGQLTGYLEGLSFGATDLNTAVGRHETSVAVDVTSFMEPTFGVSQPATLAEFRGGNGAPNASPKVGPVVISEIMYHPDADVVEYLELQNITATAVDLSAWDIDGLNWIFPEGAGIAAQGFGLLVNTNDIDPDTFRSRFDVPPSVPVWGHDFVLENEGESLRLEHPNADALAPDVFVDRVRYNDKSPWPTEADGEGPALERYTPDAYGNDPIHWRTTSAGGSPGRSGAFLSGLAIARESNWKYHARGYDLGTAWREVSYSDSGWPAGDGLLGYGSELINTVLPDAHKVTKNPTTYFRKDFVIPEDPGTVTNLLFQANYDDGFVLYLNGQEVMRSGSMPAGGVIFSTLAAGDHNSFGYELFDLSGAAPLLRRGHNVLAVEVHQSTLESDDLMWDASLTYGISTLPNLPAPEIIPNGAVFTDPLLVSIAHSSPDAEIYYTLDGTAPDASSLPYRDPLLLSDSTLVRTRAYQSGHNPSAETSAWFEFAPRIVGFTTSASTNLEANMVLEIAVALNIPSTNALQVAYRVAAETTATGNGADFTLMDGELTFAPGETRVLLPISIHDDSLQEPLESIVVALERPVGALLSPLREHRLYLQDDDSPLDSDGDTIPDDWERDHGLNPEDSMDGLGDPDEDGFTSAEEYLADTSPHDGNSLFRIVSVQIDPPRLTFPTSPRRVYTLQVNEDLTHDTWNPVEGYVQVEGSGEMMTWPIPWSAPGAFFRVNVALP